MTRRVRGLVLLGVQLLLVLSVLGKYAYERRTRPRVWVRATGVDPDDVLRGRYLALRLLVDACALPKGTPGSVLDLSLRGSGPVPRARIWRVRLAAEQGRLVPHVDEHPRSPRDGEFVESWTNEDCRSARLRGNLDYFVPERVKGPFPLKPGEELWVEVTVPPSGPPRPIGLAIAEAGGGWRPLRFE